MLEPDALVLDLLVGRRRVPASRIERVERRGHRVRIQVAGARPGATITPARYAEPEEVVRGLHAWARERGLTD